MPKKKEVEEQKTKSRSITEQAEMDVSVPDELLKRAEKEIKQMEYVTPYILAQKLSVSISTAKKVLRILAQKGSVKQVVPGRRSPIYVSIQ